MAQPPFDDGTPSSSFRVDGTPAKPPATPDGLAPLLSISPSYDSLTMPGQTDRLAVDLDHEMPFSPQDTVWEANVLPNGRDHKAHPSSEHPPFMPPGGSYGTRLDDPASQWRLDNFSGECTPTTTFDGVSAQFDPNLPAPYMPSPMSSYEGPAFNHHPFFDNAQPVALYGLEPPAFHPTPLSPPQSGTDWMAIAAQDSEAQNVPKHFRLTSPGSIKAGLARRDGVRKKNARFEIPEERNLNTIDLMIAQATNENDEELVKQLRQQKRLLRNREAALQSRQRKKSHTEQLEGEKKNYIAQIDDLHEHIHNQKSKIDHLLERIHELEYEKEVQTEEYTVDTGRLRKQISVLQEQIQCFQNAAIPASLAPNDITINHDLSHIGLGGEEWDPDFDILDQYLLEPTPGLGHEPTSPPHTSTNPPVTATAASGASKEVDKSAAPGVLLMLLLYGAFFISNSNSVSSKVTPKIPKDLQAASLTVLDNVFKDAGIPPTGQTLSRPNSHSNLQEGLTPSRRRNSSKQKARSHNQFAALEPEVSAKANHLTHLHKSLTTPTKAQEAERAFAVTPEQFNRMTNHDETYLHQPEPTAETETSTNANAPKRTLAASLASMRLDSHGSSAADVYTRSLLYDEIKPEIVLEFKKMIETSNKLKRKASNEAAGRIADSS